ncbi:MAG: DUF4013 domain-containing protein, partial [Candidatus Methylomirabilales bacterium]
LLEQVLGGEEERLPEWTGFTDLFIKGVKVFLVGFVYFAAFPLFLWMLGAGPFLSSLAALISAALEPMAQVHLARTGRIWSAFELPKVWAEIQLVLNEYLKALAIWYGILLLVGVALFGTAAPLLWILASFISFYLYLFFASLFGRACARNRVVRYRPS